MTNIKRKSAPKFSVLADKLEERCKSASIPIERGVDEDGDAFARFKMPNGRETRNFYIWQADRLKQFLDSDFEKYVFLGDYEAIASYDDSYIEAVLQTRMTSSRFVAIAFGGGPKSEDSPTVPKKIIDEDFAPGGEIEVGECSGNMLPLVIGPGRNLHRWSVKISGIAFTTHDEALSLLKRLTNSLFFQVDLTHGMVLSLRRERRLRRPLESFRKVASEPAELNFPKVEYDEAPITLYWYARSAIGMPLLQFLAFYQCIEFYYPTYSQSEARRQIRKVLKDPIFRFDRDADLTRVLGAFGTGPRGFTDERSMLRSTIRECVGKQEIREYLEHSEGRTKFFSAKTKGLTDLKIPIANAEDDLRDAVADRIYDLRCKIVHTKSGSREESAKLLLPYSKEEDLLIHDIALLRFVARQVLIAGSSDLRLK